MKRLISFFLALMLAISLCLITSANSTDSNTITVGNYTIIFDETSTLTQEEKLHIAQLRANHNHETDNHASTYGVMCNLFGHKTTTETIIVVEHQVSPTAPRCLENVEELTVCSRCDYTNVEILGSIYIYCCD